MKNKLVTILLFIMLSSGVIKAYTYTPIINCSPTAEISYGNGYGCEDQKVSFTSSLSCFEATSWEWNFGDPTSGSANTSSVENPDHIFSSYGDYTITLTINNTYTTSTVIFINSSPIADLGDDKIIHEGEIVTLDSGYPIDQWVYYDWSTGDLSPSIEVSTPDTYHVEVCTNYFFSGVCCVKDTILVTLLLGVEEEKFTTWTLSPNPFSTYTTLKFEKNLDHAVLSIHNMYGQELKKTEGINGNTIILDRENLPGGVYMIRLEQGKKIVTQKIMIKD